MSKETRQGFSRKNVTPGIKPIIVTINEATKQKLLQLTLIYQPSSVQNTIRTLIYTALKNNFTPDLNYIPCVQLSEPVNVTLPGTNFTHDPRKTYSVSFNASPKLFAKLQTIAQKYSSTMSDTVRMLITIALQYNYDESLSFKPAQPLSSAFDTQSATTALPLFIIDTI